MSEHTPGPWSESPDGSTIYRVDGVPVARIAAAGRPGDARSANARLIAAAPDMLEALEKALHLLELQSEPTDAFRYVDGVDVPAAARAAIAQARGKVTP